MHESIRKIIDGIFGTAGAPEDRPVEQWDAVIGSLESERSAARIAAAARTREHEDVLSGAAFDTSGKVEARIADAAVARRKADEVVAQIEAALVGARRNRDAAIARRNEALIAAKMARIVAAHGLHVQNLQALDEAMRAFTVASKNAKDSLWSFHQELPYRSRERFAFATGQARMLLDAKQWLAALSAGDHGVTNVFVPAHQVLAGPTLAERFEEVNELLGEIELKPEDCLLPTGEPTEVAHAA